MDEISSSAMEITGKILRTSICTFLKYFHYFSTTPILLLLPFSASALMSEAIFQPYLLCYIFHFPGTSSSGFMSGLSMMNLFSLPFTISSFLIAKASIIQALNHPKPSVPPTFSSVVSNYRPLIFTFFCNLVLIFAISAMIFALFFVPFNFLKAFSSSYISSTIFLPIARIVSYSILAKTVFVNNLALTVAGMDNSLEGYAAIYKACSLRKGKNPVALLLTLPINLGLAAIEALFRYRVLRTYHFLKGFTASVGLEGILIAYLYSLLVVLDTIACCLFYKSSSESNFPENRNDRRTYDDVAIV